MAVTELASAASPIAKDSTEKAEEEVMEDYPGELPIKNGEKKLEVQDPLIEVNLDSDEQKRPSYISSRLSAKH